MDTVILDSVTQKQIDRDGFIFYMTECQWGRLKTDTYSIVPVPYWCIAHTQTNIRSIARWWLDTDTEIMTKISVDCVPYKLYQDHVILEEQVSEIYPTNIWLIRV